MLSPQTILKNIETSSSAMRKNIIDAVDKALVKMTYKSQVVSVSFPNGVTVEVLKEVMEEYKKLGWKTEVITGSQYNDYYISVELWL